MTGDDPVPIELEGLTKSYGDLTALDEITLSIEPGCVHGLVGPNGSGKTTLFYLLLGLTRPTAGSLTVPERVGCGFQVPNFYPDLTVGENLDVFADLADADEEWVDRLTEVLGLDRVRSRVADDLSGGFGKKLDLALAFLGQPPYVLLDEPLDNLDDVSQRRLLAFLEEYPDDDRTVVVATHRVAAFQDTVDRLTVMDRGEVVFDGWVDDIDLAAGQSYREFYVDRLE